MSYRSGRSVPEELGVEPSPDDMYAPGASFLKSAHQLVQEMFDKTAREVDRLEERYSPAILASLDRERPATFDEVYSKVGAPDKIDMYYFKSVLVRLREKGLVLFSSGCHNSVGDRYWLPSYTKDAFRNMTTPPDRL